MLDKRHSQVVDPSTIARITNHNAPAQTPRDGTLASAFQELNAQISEAEGRMKALFERVQPFLEPLTAGEGQAGQTPTPSRAPLAESVFEYAQRVQFLSSGLAEILNRFSY